MSVELLYISLVIHSIFEQQSLGLQFEEKSTKCPDWWWFFLEIESSSISWISLLRWHSLVPHDLIFNWVVCIVPNCQARHSPSRRDLAFGLWFWFCMLHYAQSGIFFCISKGRLSSHLNFCHTFPQQENSSNLQSVAIFIYTETLLSGVFKISSSMTIVDTCMQCEKITLIRYQGTIYISTQATVRLAMYLLVASTFGSATLELGPTKGGVKPIWWTI